MLVSFWAYCRKCGDKYFCEGDDLSSDWMAQCDCGEWNEMSDQEDEWD